MLFENRIKSEKSPHHITQPLFNATAPSSQDSFLVQRSTETPVFQNPAMKPTNQGHAKLNDLGDDTAPIHYPP